MPTRTDFPRARTAVLLIDVIDAFDFPGGRAFAARAGRTAARIGRLRERARRRRVPVIYVNDNLGKWRSSMDMVVDACTREGVPGAAVAERLRPDDRDYVVLKSALSGFYQTPLETMLRSGGVRTVVLAGFATDLCVLFTAADAHMRDYRVVVATDCVGARNARDHREAMRRMVNDLDVRATTLERLRLSR